MTQAPPDTPPSRQTVALEEIAQTLRERDNFLVVSHMRPDGDCLGSTIGLLLGLRKIGKRVAAYNAGPIGAKWGFLDGIGEVATKLPDWTPDMTVFVDCGGVKRVSDTFEPIGATINIDHHLSNDKFANFNWIDIDACAVGEQIFALLGEFGVALDPTIASALYLSIMTDTGSFRYSNTSSRALEIASTLVAAGADPGYLAQNVFETRTRGELALMGAVFGTLRFEQEGIMVWSELLQSHYAGLTDVDGEPEGLASDIRGIAGVEISCLLHETEEGTLRASFRGKGQIDCSAIARLCGGGGHFNASGCAIKNMPYAAAKERVLGEVRKAVSEYLKSR